MPSNSTNNNGKLERGKQARWEFTISECGVSFNLTAQEGNVVLYASTETTAPNEAMYQWRIEVSATSNPPFEVTNIIPPLENNAFNSSSVKARAVHCGSRRRRMTHLGHRTEVTVFTTIVGVKNTNVFSVSTSGKSHY